ncbi:MAG TPA: hypothetical protein VF143_07180 [Candidatus Nanopelagicales bacterium]
MAVDEATQLPPVQDIAIGAAAVLTERMWAAGARTLAWTNRLVGASVGLIRAVSPEVATRGTDARLQALAERGRAVRVERGEALAASLTSAITAAVTSDAVREMTVAAIEEATDDVLAVVLPAVLERVAEAETQEQLDELMSGLLIRQLPTAMAAVADAETQGTLDELMARLLLRQLPAALEKTIPQVMLRTATRPASLLGAVLPR